MTQINKYLVQNFYIILNKRKIYIYANIFFINNICLLLIKINIQYLL